MLRRRLPRFLRGRAFLAAVWLCLAAFQMSVVLAGEPRLMPVPSAPSPPAPSATAPHLPVPPSPAATVAMQPAVESPPVTGPALTESGEPLPVPESQPAQVCGVRYWIVSSRCAPQDGAVGGVACLQFYARLCNGCLQRMSCADLVSQLQPCAPVLVSMHGSYVTWEDNLDQSEQTYRWIRCACPSRPLNVIFFTWPSDRQRTLLACCELNYRGQQAENNAFYVCSLLGCLSDCHPICLLGHSHGARMAAATLHLAGGGALQGRCLGGVGCKRLRAVLAASALDHNWLNDGQRYDRALCRSECVLSLKNCHDVALKAYPLLRLFSHRALGASGVTNMDRNRQCCTERLQSRDVTSLVGHGHFWPNYYQSRALACLIMPWVYFPESNPPASQILPQPATAEARQDAESTLSMTAPVPTRELSLGQRMASAEPVAVVMTRVPADFIPPEPPMAAEAPGPALDGHRQPQRSPGLTPPQLPSPVSPVFQPAVDHPLLALPPLPPRPARF